MGPTTIAIAFVLALLVLVPTRRLSIAGARRETLAGYFIGLWLLSLVVVLGGAPRILVAVLLLVYVAPFVTLGPGLDALRRRFGRQLGPQPMKDVTPRDDAPPPT